MTDKDPSKIFNKDRAASYDDKSARVAPIKDALHLLTRMVLSELPEDARILCVGSGTGAEIFYLASAFPKWHFTAVEPAKAMLDVCRDKAAELGISARCSFHEGYLDSLEQGEPYDAATSILVSQFLLDANKRREFFSHIASHLCRQGILINADLATELDGADYQKFMDVWLQMMRFADMPADLSAFGRDVAVLPPKDVEEIISTSGFEPPIQFCQTLFIHAWFSRLHA